MTVFLEQNLSLRFDWFYFSIYLKALYESYLTLLYIGLRFLLQSSDVIPILFTATAISVAPVLSESGPSLFVIFVASIHLYNYSFAQFQFTPFILSIICLNTISTGLGPITANKVCRFSVFGENLFLHLTRCIFLIYTKSMYESYLPLIYIFPNFFFDYPV